MTEEILKPRKPYVAACPLELGVIHMKIKGKKIKYFAVVDNVDGYFNGSEDFETASHELTERRIKVGQYGGDITDVILVAVLDV